MKVTYNEQEKAIEIKDKIKTHYFALNVMMVLNIFTASIRLYPIKDKQLGIIDYVLVFIGVLSLTVFIYQLLKNTVLEKIPIDRIRGLKEKTFFGRKRFSFVLKNGKSRDLIHIKTSSEITGFKKMFSENGIPTIGLEKTFASKT